MALGSRHSSFRLEDGHAPTTVGASMSNNLLWLRIPNKAAVADTSNIPQNYAGNYLGPCIGCSRGVLVAR